MGLYQHIKKTPARLDIFLLNFLAFAPDNTTIKKDILFQKTNTNFFDYNIL